MPKILIDDKECEAGEGKNCLEVALEKGLDLPYFCYHPALGSVGACRLCAVKQYKNNEDKTGRVIMSCMTPARDGTRISVKDPEATAFRRTAIELLMTNHPHDCPICDEGGECHLQDMTVMTGHRVRRTRSKKRTHQNQHLGPFIHHEMNRCIQCYRCVRYYQDYAGGDDLVALAQRNNVYFGRHEEGVLESPFSGNLIDICPTGVFTDKTFRQHFTRQWDLETAPSVCTHCSVGCNILPAARYGKLKRITPRYNEAVNGYFICDRGRFGYEYHHQSSRLIEASQLTPQGRQDLSAEDSWQHLQQALRPGSDLAGIASPRASVESNFALKKLVGEVNFYVGIGEKAWQTTEAGTALMRERVIPSASMQELESADAIIVLGCDVSNEVPRADLAIRQAVRKGATLLIASLRATSLDQIATEYQRASPEQMLKVLKDFASNKSLKKAQRVALLIGAYQVEPKLWPAVQQCAQKLQEQKVTVTLNVAFPEANSVGLALLQPSALDSLLEVIESGEIKRLLVIEEDLFQRSVNPDRLRRCLDRLEELIVFDHTRSKLSSLASLAIPVATSLESNGLWINWEGRASRAYQVYRPDPWRPSSWEILRELPEQPEDLIATLAKENAAFASACEVGDSRDIDFVGQKVPRQSPRASGRMALPVWKDVRTHARPPEDKETPFNFSMEGFSGKTPSALQSRFWVPNWNSQEAIGKFQMELGKGLHGGPAGVRLFDGENVKVNSAGPVPGESSRQGSARQKTADDPSVSSPVPPASSLLIIPVAEIFGTDPLSRLSPAVAERIPEAYLEIHPESAQQFSWEEGSTQSLKLNGAVSALTIRYNEELPLNIAVVPAGFPESNFLQASIEVTP